MVDSVSKVDTGPNHGLLPPAGPSLFSQSAKDAGDGITGVLRALLQSLRVTRLVQVLKGPLDGGAHRLAVFSDGGQS